MKVQAMELNKNNILINEYRKEQNFVKQYFDYHPFSESNKRLAYVQSIKRDRQTLADALYNMNLTWNAPSSTMQQIERLRQNDSVVVIGGQQAGLLTGPLYSLNKLISVYVYARKKEEELGVPVIPVFWIAGEDHDYDEINHVFSVANNKIYKHATKQQEVFKKSVSHIPLNKEETEKWLKQLFLDMQETTYTKQLYTDIQVCLKESNTFVDFFAKIIYEIFELGIILFDSAHEEARNLEREYFTRLIEHNEQIAEEVYQTVQNLQHEGYSIPLDVTKEDAHIFYHDENNERVLLKREDGMFVGKNNEIKLTKEELLQTATYHPYKLSNNVITRPLMQEMLFPTLAFLAGDGEISYWSALQSAFHVLDEKMPIIVPRLSFSYITKRTNKLLQNRVLNIEEVIQEGVMSKKVQWLHAQHQPALSQLFEQAKEALEKIHEPLQDTAEEIAPDIHLTSKKNLQLLLKQLDFLERKMHTAVENKYIDSIEQFDEIERVLHPNNGLQERVYSPLWLLNNFGYKWIEQLSTMENLCFENEHYIVYIH